MKNAQKLAKNYDGVLWSGRGFHLFSFVYWDGKGMILHKRY